VIRATQAPAGPCYDDGMRTRLVALLIVAAGAGAGCGPGEGPNRPPTVTGSPVTTPEETPVTGTFTATDPDGDRLEFRYGTSPHGTVVGDGPSFTYTPELDFAGIDTVTITVLDGETLATATIAIDVTQVNDAPVAENDLVAGREDTTTIVPAATVLANDTDVDGDTLTITAVADARNGTVALIGDAIHYTPAPSYEGVEALRYTVSDGALTATATVLLMVDEVNDAPVASDDVATTPEDLALTITAAALVGNDTDLEGQTLGVTAVGAAVNGTVALAAGVVTFTPTADYHGPASFTYTVSDGADTDVGTVAVTVTPTADAPRPVADAFDATEDTARTIPTAQLTSNDLDPDGDALTVTAVANPLGGTVTLAGGVATFTPAPNLTGVAGFDYTVSDGGLTASARVTLTVAAVPDAPVAGDDSAVIAEDTPLVVAGAVLTANDADVDGPALTVTAVGAAVRGVVALAGGAVTFTPEPNYVGPASFEYTVSDGALTDVGRVAITVTPVNDAPVAVADVATTAEDTAIAIPTATLTANDTDVDGPALTVTAVGGATGGAVALAGGVVTFTPAPDRVGAADFTYTVSDGALTATGAVAITITPVNDRPTATAGTATTAENTPVTVTLTGADLDLDALTFAVGAATVGTLGPVTATGPTTATVVYTPPINYDGAASFTFTASDAALTSAPATIAITITNVPVCGDGVIELPETCDDDGAVGGDGCSATCAVESGWTCSGLPSGCDELCGDGQVVGGEPCDDGNPVETDGCTTACVAAPPCDPTRDPAGDRFAVEPTTGACYVGVDDELTSAAAAAAACVAGGGHLATITSAGEQALVAAVANDTQNPWLGAVDDANDTDAVFAWQTGEPWGFTAWAPDQPDDDAGLGGTGECLHVFDGLGRWNDTNCAATGFVVGRVCEYAAVPCGDGVLHTGEACDDGNRVSFDGCSASCRIENLFFSEYVEGSVGFNKALEIANPTATARPLTGCALRLYTNGSPTVSQTLVLTQTIAAGDVLVVCHPSSDAAVLAQCDVTSSAVANWNGDDTIELVCDGATLDVFGQIGVDPGTAWGLPPVTTIDQTLRRRCAVSSGDAIGNDPFVPSAEWTSLGTNVYSDLGARTCSP
jgi:cysteine-rich repeat protein